MPSPRSHSQSSIKGRTRRRHHKSRNGCAECKRRRIKCDEVKPACTRCVATLHKCIYALAPLSAIDDQGDELSEFSLPSSSCSPFSLSPGGPRFSDSLPTFEAFTHQTSVIMEESHHSNDMDVLEPSDTFLYNHYINHTSHKLTYGQKDQGALQIGMPTLALQSRTVFHSLLATSAACLCCDMISQDSSDINAVKRVLMTGYRHYNLASERMREMISQRDPLKPDSLLAGSSLLVPFATASQQINHWISSKTETEEQQRLLCVTPRDVIVILRGIKTTLQALGGVDARVNLQVDQKKTFKKDSCSSLLEFNNPPRNPPPSHSHVMFPIVAATSREAFSKLQERLELASIFNSDIQGDIHDDSLSACIAAFEILTNLRTNTFSPSEFAVPPWLGSVVKRSADFEVLLPEVTPWLRSYSTRPAIPLPEEPLTRPFLAFLVLVPQTYIDLVLPLLDQRLEGPIADIPKEGSVALTREQALALDIYAHWSVLMLLVEEESWWIGNLPVVTLTGMVKKYGFNFVTRLWSREQEEEQWWPGSMLKILTEIKRYR